MLADVRAPWCVAAGWALDLFLGGERREHEDLEIAVPSDRFDEIVVALADYELFIPGEEKGRSVVWPLADAGERVETRHQTWVREPETGYWRLDVFREPSADGEWVCRRDESIRLPYEEVIVRTESGVPYMRPELVLLFKAKHARPKDDEDFDAVLPHLDAAPGRWLRERLAVVHPGHRWLAKLG